MLNTPPTFVPDLTWPVPEPNSVVGDEQDD